jgi:hypothetical protein
MAQQGLLDPAIEAFDHTVRLWPHRGERWCTLPSRADGSSNSSGPKVERRQRQNCLSVNSLSLAPVPRSIGLALAHFVSRPVIFIRAARSRSGEPTGDTGGRRVARPCREDSFPCTDDLGCRSGVALPLRAEGARRGPPRQLTGVSRRGPFPMRCRCG